MLQKRIELLRDFIYRLNDEVQIMIVNEYNDYQSKHRVYLNDDDGIEELTCGMEIPEIFRALSYGSYGFLDKYVTINSYGNIVSSDSLDVDFTAIAEWMIDKENSSAEDAWTILQNSMIYETGEYIDDLGDEFSYSLMIEDVEKLKDWIGEKSNEVEFKYWFLISWYDIFEDFSVWLQEHN